MLTQSFYAHRSQKRKTTDDLTVIFVLLGSMRLKAERKTLMKLTPGVAVAAAVTDAAETAEGKMIFLAC